jgi:hypothetical protein
MFLGSAAAAGVGAAVGGALVFPAFGTQAQTRVATDPVLAELQAQIFALVTAVRKGTGRPAEHARRLAASIRLINAQGAGASVDAELRRRLRDEGRSAILNREIDFARLGVELKAVGVDRLPVLSATDTDRARVLDATVRNGMAATLATVGAAFEQIAPVIERLTVTAVANRQDVDCWEWLLFLTNLEALMLELGFIDPAIWQLIVWLYVAYATFMCSIGCVCVL